VVIIVSAQVENLNLMTHRGGGENKLKKILTLCLALMLALSVTSSAFAGFRPFKYRGEKEKSSSFNQRTTIINKSEAKTGNAIAIGNVSATFICNPSIDRISRGYLWGGEIDRGYFWGDCGLWDSCNSCGDGGFLWGSNRDSRICVENNGNAVAYSGAAHSENIVDNNICTDVRK
jgi:hypothetical protein